MLGSHATDQVTETFVINLRCLAVFGPLSGDIPEPSPLLVTVTNIKLASFTIRQSFPANAAR
jgi:hypothetical protein